MYAEPACPTPAPRRQHLCGLALFSKEPNHWGCNGYACVEISLVGPEHAWAAYQLTHPSCRGASGAALRRIHALR